MNDPRVPTYRVSSPPPSQITAVCFFCAQAGMPDKPCLACMVKVPDPFATVTLRDTSCQRCGGQLLAIAIDTSNATVHCCNRCHGMFVPPRAWCTLIAFPDLALEVERRLPPPAGAIASASNTMGLLRCPACPSPREMDRGRFAASSAIVIDVCEQHGLWLDAGELGAVVRHAAQRLASGARVNNTGLAASSADWPPSQTKALAQQVIVLQERLHAQQAQTERSSRFSILRTVKLSFAVIAALALVFEACVSLRASSNVKSQGDQSVKAAEGARRALGP